MINLLIIAYFFPPSKSVGSFRIGSFTKYLPKDKFKISLLTANKTIFKNKLLQQEYNLSKVYHAKESRVRYYGYKYKFLALLEMLKIDGIFFFPDIYRSWIKRAVKEGRKALIENNFDAILVTGPPFSTFVVAYQLSKEFNTKLILDYRDPWSKGGSKKQFRGRKQLKLEKSIVNHANTLITIGRDCADFIANYLKISSKDFYVIHNGFYSDKININQYKTKDKSNIFTIIYFGNFYYERIRLLKQLTKAIGKLVKKLNLTPNDLIFKYAGSNSRKVLYRIIKKAEIQPYFKDLGYIDHATLLKEVNASSLATLFLPKSLEYALPTKLYDYAIGNSHFFILSDNKENYPFFDKLEQKYTVAPSDLEGLTHTLEKLYMEWKSNRLEYGCNWEILMKYDRKKLAEELEKILYENLKNEPK